MADNTIIQQGVFTSRGVPETIVMRSDVDWMETWNETTTAAGVQWDSTYHYWQREMPFGDHIIHYHAAASQVISATTGIAGFNGVANRAGFYPINSSLVVPGAAVAVTAGTNVTSPVYSTANTGAIGVGSIVRIQNTAHTNLNGLDFTVGAFTAATSFTMSAVLATAPGVVAGAAGTYRYIAPDLATYKLFYPGNRVIANITAANPAVVTTLVDHGYTTGQVIRMKVPAVCGMTQMDGLLGTVTNLTANTFSLNIDSTLFTAFNFPLPAVVPFTPAEVIPMGDVAGGTLLGATFDQSYVGIVLGSGGIVSGTPSGVAGDVIKWRAGKSFNGV
jgi:hypothetical protein